MGLQQTVAIICDRANKIYYKQIVISTTVEKKTQPFSVLFLEETGKMLLV